MTFIHYIVTRLTCTYRISSRWIRSRALNISRPSARIRTLRTESNDDDDDDDGVDGGEGGSALATIRARQDR